MMIFAIPVSRLSLDFVTLWHGNKSLCLTVHASVAMVTHAYIFDQVVWGLHDASVYYHAHSDVIDGW